jgi:hypothetical protein
MTNSDSRNSGSLPPRFRGEREVGHPTTTTQASQSPGKKGRCSKTCQKLTSHLPGRATQGWACPTRNRAPIYFSHRRLDENRQQSLYWYCVLPDRSYALRVTPI